MTLYLLEIYRDCGHRLVGIYSSAEHAQEEGFKDKEMRDDLSYFVIRVMNLDSKPELIE